VRALEDSVFSIGDALVSISARTVCRNGESLRLRPKNFELLFFLIQCRGRIATKDEILRQVWPGVAVTENSLVKCVSELRKALGDDLRNPRFLKSVPKVGYELVGVIEKLPNDGLPGATTLEVQQTSTVAVEYREEISSDAQSWRNPLVWGLVAAGVLLLAGTFRGWPGSRGAAPAPPFHWREVAWWKLDEGKGAVAHDASGNGLDGDLTKGVMWSESGLRFNGLDAAIVGRTRGRLPAGDRARTMSAWIKLALPLVDASAIFSYSNSVRGRSESSFGFGLTYAGTIGFGSPRAHGSSTGTRRLADDAWHMVTATYDGPSSSMARIFIDGELDRAEKLEGRPFTSDGPLWQIGRYWAGDTAFRGSIKDVRLYDRALIDQQIAALYTCTAGTKDIGDYYYLPISLPGFVRETPAAGSPSTPFRNDGKDFSGVQLARSDGQCAITNVEGADMGQDLRISMDVLTPTDATGGITQAGPYFRSRIAGPGDGLMGGTSAGYWVQLHSNGMVKVRRLNPLAVVAFSSAIPVFDTDVFHSLKMEARGAGLQVWLDGKSVRFEQGGRQVDRVDIPAAWERPERVGENQGTAGVCFGAEDNRGQIGGQRVKNLIVVRLD